MTDQQAPKAFARVTSVDPSGQNSVKFELIELEDGSLQLAAGAASDPEGFMRTVAQFAEDITHEAAVALFVAMANVDVSSVQVKEAISDNIILS